MLGEGRGPQGELVESPSHEGLEPKGATDNAGVARETEEGAPEEEVDKQSPRKTLTYPELAFGDFVCRMMF